MIKSVFLAILFFSSPLLAQDHLPYKQGEYSEYEVSFRGITVGRADLTLETCTTINSTSTFHVIGKGRTALFFDWFFKVRDIYETFLDTAKVLPVKFIRDISEGTYSKKQVYDFNHKKNIVYCKDTSYYIPMNTHDMLSAFFYARTFTKEGLKKEKSFFVPIFMDEENYSLEILYLKNEIIKTKFGSIDCMVFKPKMQEGRVFEDGEEMKIWISDDKNHLLIRVETRVWAGMIKANIVDYKELKYPLSIIKTEKNVKK